MITTTVVRRIGNSLGMIVPQEIIKSMGLQEGSEVILQLGDGLKITPCMIGDREFVAALNSVISKNEKLLRSLHDEPVAKNAPSSEHGRIKVRP